MPRVKTDAERGYIGAWMRNERLAHGWSPEAVVERVSGLGQRIRVDYYRSVEAGKKPGPELLDALVRLYGSEPQPFPEPEVTEDDDLAGAIRAQAAAIDRLVDELRSAREAAQPDLAEVVARSVEAALRAAGVPAGSTGQ